MAHFAQVLKKFERISLCQIIDSLGPSQEFESEIKPIGPNFRLCGPAFTVSCPADDNLTLHHALHAAKPGEILVVSGRGSCKTALWGELMSTSARARGLGGTIIDGAVRDSLELEAIGYPVFARTTVPRRATKEKYGELGTTIRCGRLQVNPGDIIFADINGITAIAPDKLEETLFLATETVKKEAAMKKKIRMGLSIFEILNLESKIPKGKIK